MSKKTVVVVCCVALAGLAGLGLLVSCTKKEDPAPTINPNVRGEVVVYLPHVFMRAFGDIKEQFERTHPNAKLVGEIGLIDEIVQKLIKAEAKPDVFLSIGELELRPLKAEGLIVPDTSRVFASTSLAVLVVKGNPLDVAELTDLANPEVKTIAIPEPKFNSAGYGFVQSMQKLGIWEQIQGKIIEKPLPNAATKPVEENKGVDACVTYGSCYLHGHANTTNLVQFIPSDLHERIDCPAVLIRGGANPEAAREFMDFLLTDDAQELWEKWGFRRARARTKGVVRSLLVPCGAGIRPVMDEIGELYQKKTGVRIDFAYSGAGMLLASMMFSRTGDLYMPGEMFYLQQAEKRGFLVDKRIVAYFVPVIIVRKGNPKNVKTVEDMARPGMVIGVGDPEALPVGPITQNIFERAGIKERIEPNITIKAACIPELGNGVKLRVLDAAIIWDALAYYYEDSVDMIEIPPELNEYAVVPIGVLTFARDRDAAARDFMEFVASDEAKTIFQKHRFRTEKPEGIRAACLGGPCDVGQQ